ncbi:General transcription factor IIF subunit 2 [Glugoides intestinalis]
MLFNTGKKKITVCLVKFPKYIGEQIMNLKKGTVVASLKVDNSKGAEAPKMHIKLANSVIESGVPSEHTVELKNKDGSICLVRSGEKKLEVEGVVNKEFFIRPVINSEYLKFKRELKNKELQDEEKVKVLNYFTEVKRNAKYSTIREMDMLAKKRKQMLQDKKRERLGKDYVLEIVFNAFEKHELWTVKDLADFSGQPVGYIQEIVNEICILNKMDHKNTYELKPEYKNRE